MKRLLAAALLLLLLSGPAVPGGVPSFVACGEGTCLLGSCRISGWSVECTYGGGVSFALKFAGGKGAIRAHLLCIRRFLHQMCTGVFYSPPLPLAPGGKGASPFSYVARVRSFRDPDAGWKEMTFRGRGDFIMAGRTFYVVASGETNWGGAFCLDDSGSLAGFLVVSLRGGRPFGYCYLPEGRCPVIAQDLLSLSPGDFVALPDTLAHLLKKAEAAGH